MTESTSIQESSPGPGDIDLTDEQIVEMVATWIRERRAGALVRFGEGEGRLLVTRVEDEESIQVAAKKVKRQAGISLSVAQVLELRDFILRAFDEANIVGIRGSDWFNEEHLMWVKRIDDLFKQRLMAGRKPTFVGHCLVSSRIRDALPDLLKAQSRVSVVSSRDLEGFFRDNYNVNLRVYQIPSQYIMRNVDGEYESRLHGVPIWPNFFEKLREELVVREPGEVFLVGAGLFGKELCIRIKEMGGIALDLGSCLDDLAGKVTRGRHKPAAWTGPRETTSSVSPPAVPPAAEACRPDGTGPRETTSSVPPPAGPAAARTSRPGKAIARTVYPYLEKSGWVRSHASGASVDASGRAIPWYRYAAIDFFAERVADTMHVFEFGCGNSTLWWAERTASVTAVEHDSAWATRIAEAAPPNVAIIEIELLPDGEYCRTPLRCDRQFDVIIIDGRDRVNCALQCLQALAPGGVIVWDDSHRRRYRHGLRFLQRNDFKRIRFTGLGPISPAPGETSILYRAVNSFHI